MCPTLTVPGAHGVHPSRPPAVWPGGHTHDTPSSDTAAGLLHTHPSLAGEGLLNPGHALHCRPSEVNVSGGHGRHWRG